MPTPDQKDKPRYKIINWAKYNEALVNRGNLTFWISEEVIQEWKHKNDEGRQGRPFQYSDLAIETLLTVRELYQLPYRTTEGFGKWIFQLMQLELSIPDYTSLCKRAAALNLSFDLKKKKGKIDVIVDSTGLKVYGEGEWKMRTHGKSQRRTWRKLHLMIDAETQEIVAECLTTNSVHDTVPVEEMLDEQKTPIGKFYGDGIFDTWSLYATLDQQGIVPIVPPQHNAKIKQHGNSKLPKLPRDEAIRGCRKLGRKGWKIKVGYHRRSLVETAMFRMKTLFGGRLKNRHIRNQKTESRIRCKILNHFTRLGMPKYR
jgi:hypothetical protein